jgi:hypothetical protein
MIRNFRDINSDIPCPLTPHYLQTILQYSKNDAKSDITWTTVPIAVVGNVERLALSANRIKVFPKRAKQPMLKWKQQIKDCELNELVKAMDQSDLDALYENEEGLWQYLAGARLAGATAVLTENLCIARGLANGTRVVFLPIGFYVKVTHDRVLNDIQGAIQRHETEVILPGPAP